MKHEHTRGSGGMLLRGNLKVRSSKTAGSEPKTRILPLNTWPLYGHAPLIWSDLKQIIIWLLAGIKVMDIRATKVFKFCL